MEFIIYIKAVIEGNFRGKDVKIKICVVIFGPFKYVTDIVTQFPSNIFRSLTSSLEYKVSRDTTHSFPPKI